MFQRIRLLIIFLLTSSPTLFSQDPGLYILSNVDGANGGHPVIVDVAEARGGGTVYCYRFQQGRPYRDVPDLPEKIGLALFDRAGHVAWNRTFDVASGTEKVGLHPDGMTVTAEGNIIILYSEIDYHHEGEGEGPVGYRRSGALTISEQGNLIANHATSDYQHTLSGSEHRPLLIAMSGDIVTAEPGAVALLSDMGSSILCWMNDAGEMRRVGYYEATDRPADVTGYSIPRAIVRDSADRILIAGISDRHDRPYQGRLIMVDDSGAIVRARQLDGSSETGISGMFTLRDGRILIYGAESAEEIDYAGVEPNDWRGHMIRSGQRISSMPTYWIFDPELDVATAYTVHTQRGYTGISKGSELDDGTIILLVTASFHGGEALSGIVVHPRDGKTSFLSEGSVDLSTVKSIDPTRFASLDSIVGPTPPTSVYFNTLGFGTDARGRLIRFGMGFRTVPFVVIGNAVSQLDCLDHSIDTVSITSRPADLIDVGITGTIIELERSDQESGEISVETPPFLLMPVCGDEE